MKWIIDAQLPPKLKTWFSERDEQAIHVFDFASLFGLPPQTVFISVGNCSNEKLMSVLNTHFRKLINSIKSNSSLVIVTQSEIYLYQ